MKRIVSRAGRLLSIVAVSALVGLAGAGPVAAHGGTASETAPGVPAARTEALFNTTTRGTGIQAHFLREAVGAENLGYPVEVDASLFHLASQRVANLFLMAAQDGVVVHLLLDGSNRTLGCHGDSGCVNPAFTILTGINN